MKNLFEISGELERTLRELETYCNDNQTDELPDELAERLVINQDELADKLDAYYHVITQIKAEREALKAYKKTIVERVGAKDKALQSNIERLSNLMMVAVDKFGEERKNGNKFFKLPTVSVNLTASKAVKVVDEELLPNEFIKTKITESVDKTAIKEKFKAGGVVPGAEMEEGWNIGFR